MLEDLKGKPQTGEKPKKQENLQLKKKMRSLTGNFLQAQQGTNNHDSFVPKEVESKSNSEEQNPIYRQREKVTPQSRHITYLTPAG